jgi:hypothetical protein
MRFSSFRAAIALASLFAALLVPTSAAAAPPATIDAQTIAGNIAPRYEEGGNNSFTVSVDASVAFEDPQYTITYPADKFDIDPNGFFLNAGAGAGTYPANPLCSKGTVGDDEVITCTSEGEVSEDAVFEYGVNITSVGTGDVTGDVAFGLTAGGIGDAATDTETISFLEPKNYSLGVAGGHAPNNTILPEGTPYFGGDTLPYSIDVTGQYTGEDGSLPASDVTVSLRLYDDEATLDPDDVTASGALSAPVCTFTAGTGDDEGTHLLACTFTGTLGLGDTGNIQVPVTPDFEGWGWSADQPFQPQFTVGWTDGLDQEQEDYLDGEVVLGIHPAPTCTGDQYWGTFETETEYDYYATDYVTDTPAQVAAAGNVTVTLACEADDEGALTAELVDGIGPWNEDTDKYDGPHTGQFAFGMSGVNPTVTWTPDTPADLPYDFALVKITDGNGRFTYVTVDVAVAEEGPVHHTATTPVASKVGNTAYVPISWTITITNDATSSGPARQLNAFYVTTGAGHTIVTMDPATDGDTCHLLDATAQTCSFLNVAPGDSRTIAVTSKVKVSQLPMKATLWSGWTFGDGFEITNANMTDFEKQVSITAPKSMTFSASNDTVTGTSGANTYRMGAGNDTARLGKGNDTGDGGKGKDKMYGQDGNDSLNCGTGTGDLTDGGAGRDKLKCRDGKGGDTMNGGKGNRDECIGDKKDIFRNCEIIRRG